MSATIADPDSATRNISFRIDSPRVGVVTNPLSFAWPQKLSRAGYAFAIQSRRWHRVLPHILSRFFML
jgi:hypothetical protein